MIFDKYCNTAIREFLDIGSLLLLIERSQRRWFGHVSRMPHERLHKQTLYAKMSGKKPFRRRRTRWLVYIEDLGWNRLKPHPSEMQFVLVDREMWQFNLELLPLQYFRKSGRKKGRIFYWRSSSKLLSIVIKLMIFIEDENLAFLILCNVQYH